MDRQLLEKLNPSQLEAVTSAEKYIRVIAGAGSGKTKVLTTRIAYLIAECGVLSNRILAITFTNKAANEMKKRVAALLGLETCRAHISTYHSFCARFLREEIHVFGYPSDFIIVDEEDQEKIIKKIIEEFPASVSLKPSTLLNYISHNKNHNVSPAQAETSIATLYGDNVRSEVYALYEEYLKHNHYVDFDDLLLLTVKILETYPEIRSKWTKRFQYILVDEFQDTNDLQYELLQLLTNENTAVFVVGDPDQTIYTWRGADINIILDFPRYFKGTKDYVLAKNYRSTKNILDCANALIVNNIKRVEKDLVTDNDAGAKIICYQAYTAEAEALWVADRIKELLARNPNLSYNDFAVLYRSNYYSRSFENAFINRKIPYSIYGGVKFFQRKEVKDAVCYLRLLCKSSDNLAFDRIINTPKRGVGDKTLANIYNVAKSEDKSPIDYLIDKYQTPTTAIPLSILAQAYRDAREKLENKDDTTEYGELLLNLLEDAEYMEALREGLEDDRIENIEELARYLTGKQKEVKDISLSEILQEIALYSAQDEIEDKETVTLMTVHTAKGLEFPFVFVVGLAEHIFPNARSISSIQATSGLDSIYEDDDKVEEERRLAYVAFTRAQHQLILTYNTGFDYVSHDKGTASRFIREIHDVITPYRRFVGSESASPTVSTNHVAKHTVLQSTSVAYRPGDIVNHRTFGDGVVIGVNESFLEIAFKDVNIGTKSISNRFTGLKKVS